ncbi:MAG TPA: tetratricopeptide repeat protein [Syntrophales bacterium]|nr:tetratricopeptide repeat protein [Syntrophales bacterium]
MSMKTDIAEFFDLADRHMREGRYDEAISLYRKLSQMHPEDDSLVMSLACAYRDSDRLSEAVLCLERLLKKELQRKTFTGFAFDELVKIYRNEGNHERLVAICESAVAVQPDDVSLMITLGNAYLKAGKASKAVEIFTTLTEMEPDAPSLFCNLGKANIAAGDFNRAEEAYGRAVAIEASDAYKYYCELGMALFQAQQYERSETALKRSLDCRPDQPLVHCALGDVFIKQGKPDDAWRSYERAVKLDPVSGGGYYNRLGNMLVGEHNHTMASEAYRKAIEADPENQFYRMRLAELSRTEPDNSSLLSS